MKNLILFLLVFLGACVEQDSITKDNLPEINLSTAYPLSNTEIDITGNLLSDELKQMVEYGIVWSEKQNPTIDNQKKL